MSSKRKTPRSNTTTPSYAEWPLVQLIDHFWQEAVAQHPDIQRAVQSVPTGLSWQKQHAVLHPVGIVLFMRWLDERGYWPQGLWLEKTRRWFPPLAAQMQRKVAQRMAQEMAEVFQDVVQERKSQGIPETPVPEVTAEDVKQLAQQIEQEWFASAEQTPDVPAWLPLLVRCGISLYAHTHEHRKVTVDLLVAYVQEQYGVKHPMLPQLIREALDLEFVQRGIQVGIAEYFRTHRSGTDTEIVAYLQEQGQWPYANLSALVKEVLAEGSGLHWQTLLEALNTHLDALYAQAIREEAREGEVSRATWCHMQALRKAMEQCLTVWQIGNVEKSTEFEMLRPYMEQDPTMTVAEAYRKRAQDRADTAE